MFIGMMSGTSIDAVDGVLAAFDGEEQSAPARTVAFASIPIPPALRTELLALQQPGPDELARSSLARIELTDLYARVALELIQHAPAQSVIRAIGAHGQTVRHRPELGYTLQIIDGARLAELTACTTVIDFRSADVAAGGQGAPLVPAFHALAFASKDRLRAVVNIGGIANVSMIPPRPIQASSLAETHPGAPGTSPAAPSIVGFDTGPGNLLMDAWCEQHLGHAYDAEGRWARGGVIIDSLLNQMLADRYFELAPPKSTGRDLFSPAWLAGHLSGSPPARPQDVQATLAELTARSIASACLDRGAGECRVCGGGAQNTYLMDRLGALMPGIEATSTAALGVDPGAVEALAFAWLARERLAARPANLPSVTGARGLRVLGAVYPASSGA